MPTNTIYYFEITGGHTNYVSMLRDKATGSLGWQLLGSDSKKMVSGIFTVRGGVHELFRVNGNYYATLELPTDFEQMNDRSADGTYTDLEGLPRPARYLTKRDLANRSMSRLVAAQVIAARNLS